ncbi:hypothetical protein [Beijerinckia indica]|uniref:Uncharacterized protein n=1 Tax=Beijerinckia indica subsp. indica (strain ATCC 9039 / DSM 1715 / NCIMB 8712) TaxID=395963 RepID=B2ICE7_BEII9|nr:hypothetical protein [Beijerinckia indica]ACB96744.1 conserved hypothetical protein [Beijerinckia indica subsp. indica ATCC 9039]
MNTASLPLLRALPLFTDLPAGHKAVLVRQDDFEPHLRIGEFAVVDTTDKDVAYGELYMLCFRRGLRIVQPYKFPSSIPDVGVWFRFAMPAPGRTVMADGPLKFECWPEKCFGRIVGLFEPLETVAHGSSLYREA